MPFHSNFLVYESRMGLIQIIYLRSTSPVFPQIHCLKKLPSKSIFSEIENFITQKIQVQTEHPNLVNPWNCCIYISP